MTGDIIIPSGVTEIKYQAFYGCSGLGPNLVLPDGITNIGPYAFYNCTGLKGNLDLPKSLTCIERYAFQKCTGFTGDLVIPDGVTEIREYTFKDCTGFNGTLTLPKNLIVIKTQAFHGLSRLKGDIIIPETVISITQSAFYGCNNVKNIYLYNAECAITDKETNSKRTFPANAVIIGYPESTAYDYTQTFGHQFRCIGEHVWGEEWQVETAPTPDKEGTKYQQCIYCDEKQWETVPVLAKLKFAGASLALQNDLSIKYMVSSSFFEEVGYENPYIIFNLNGEEIKLTDYIVDGGYYLFYFNDIAPHKMNDTVYSTLYASYNGTEYSSEAVPYSVADYCYNMLDKYAADTYAEFRTLLVDLLGYGAKSQIYMNYNTDNLVDAALTETQKSWGTAELRTLTSVMNPAYKEVENPTVTWRGAALRLNDSITMRFMLKVDNAEGLTLKVTSNVGTWELSADEFIKTNEGYDVLFDGLTAIQLSEPVYATVYKDGVAVSNTVCYSVESYVICGDNCENKEYGITDEDILGVLTGFYRDNRKINMNGIFYKTYVRIWVGLYPLRLFYKSTKRKVKKAIKYFIKITRKKGDE